LSIRVIPLTLSGNSFGEAFVHSILARGDKVIATGRNAESRLAHLKGTGAAILDLDVTSPQEILDSKIQEAIAIYGKIDVLINNAAYGELAFLEEME
jgi:NAD(P)-dependent dehydrogenase (short-subunit alcohol dehydrogenase family)